VNIMAIHCVLVVTSHVSFLPTLACSCYAGDGQSQLAIVASFEHDSHTFGGELLHPVVWNY
jgi:hypothetical protein